MNFIWIDHCVMPCSSKLPCIVDHNYNLINGKHTAFDTFIPALSIFWGLLVLVGESNVKHKQPFFMCFLQDGVSLVQLIKNLFSGTINQISLN